MITLQGFRQFLFYVLAWMILTIIVLMVFWSFFEREVVECRDLQGQIIPCPISAGGTPPPPASLNDSLALLWRNHT